ncbi:MAG: type IV pilus assembly protein PilW, partial [Motiliproteus sp.]
MTISFNLPSVPGKQAGFSMVELMVALVLGMFVTTAVLQVFVGSKQVYEFQQEFSRMQENGRFAMNFLTEDIRGTDFWGCVKGAGDAAIDAVASILNGDLSSSIYAAGLVGYNQVPAASTGYTSTFGGAGAVLPDAILLQGAWGSGVPIVAPPGINSLTQPQMPITSVEGIKQGDILLVSDCTKGVIFQVTKDPNPSNKIVFHQANGGVVNESPGNSQNGLGVKFDGSAQVFRAEFSRYWIRPGVSGEPALVRGTDTDAWTGGDELVDGVENMQILYGVDLDNDKTPDYFVDADVVNTAGNMDKVVSVQIHLVVRSLRDNMSAPAPIEYYGGPEPVHDRRLRKVFMTTVA